MTSIRRTRPSRNEYTCVTSRSASSVPSSARTIWCTATATRPSPASADRRALDARVDLLELPAPVAHVVAATDPGGGGDPGGDLPCW